jgi:hypothetical protein
MGNITHAHMRTHFVFYVLLSRDLSTRRVVCFSSNLILLCI